MITSYVFPSHEEMKQIDRDMKEWRDTLAAMTPYDLIEETGMTAPNLDDLLGYAHGHMAKIKCGHTPMPDKVRSALQEIVDAHARIGVKYGRKKRRG